MPPDPRESFRCTDCGDYFAGRPYWTGDITQPKPSDVLPFTGVAVSDLPIEERKARLCPDCTGPFLGPDDPADPRKPEAVDGRKVSA